MKPVLLFLLLMDLSLTNLSHADESAGLWPRYRHDTGLTGFSPLKGGLGEAPKALWAVDLGGSSVPAERGRGRASRTCPAGSEGRTDLRLVERIGAWRGTSGARSGWKRLSLEL